MQIIASEIAKRLPLTNESRRLFHGRGHFFPGYEDIFIDWFEPCVLVSLYAEREVGWLTDLVSLLTSRIAGLKTVYLHERFKRVNNVTVLFGKSRADVEAVESGLRYRLRLGDAQNIGFFLDMAKGRTLVRSRSGRKKVLNLFAYTCSFSVAALAGGAASVVNVDMNRGALEIGRENHRINKLDPREVSFLSLEVFRSMGRLKKLGPFDLVICDPPAYQGKSFKAERDWPKLLRKLPDLLSNQAEVIACLNGPHLPPRFLQKLFYEIRPEMRFVEQIQPGEDFPEKYPERGVWGGLYRLPQEGSV